ncbi:MAG: glycosylase [Chitinophagaceae bacterium]
MKTFPLIPFLLLLLAIAGCENQQKKAAENMNKDFSPKMVEFTPYPANPVFQGSGVETWDKKIRERGFILYEDSGYKMWYTGYNGTDTVTKYLGYATSADGIKWERYATNPIFTGKWVEDMCVIKNEGSYYMYAEGRNDVAHLLTSTNGINWQEQGDLKIRTVDGKSIPGPYGTPAVWTENGKWFLFYERNDEAIWLAESSDHINWKNVQDEPVIKKGPEEYDKGAVAANQVIKYKDNYYLYYHASSDPMGSAKTWSSNVAMSTDLVHWVKYDKNPIVTGNHSSPIVVFNGNDYLLYTMHPQVYLYLPEKK